MSTEKLLKQADAIAGAKLPEEASVDLQSFVATYKAKVKAKDERARAVWARAVVNRANLEGIEGKGGGGGKPTKAELLEEIERRNADRADEDKIVPASEKNADLEQALADDDAK